jgi:hypothetical protein
MTIIILSADEPEVNRSSADGKRQTNGPPPFQAPLLAELNKCLAEEAGGHFVLTEEDIGLLPGYYPFLGIFKLN